MSATIQVTPKQLLGYTFVAVGALFLIAVAVFALLLTNHTISPLSIDGNYQLGATFQVALFFAIGTVAFMLCYVGTKFVNN